jgi:lysophospholipase L1-like esterase
VARAALWLGVVGLLVLALDLGGDDPGHDVPDGRTRVLVVGDSVTQGWPGSCTWRYYFWERLSLRGVVDDIDLVGPRTGVYDDLDWDVSGAYADENFDQDHAAMSGAELGTDGGPPGESIDVLVARYRPDVVLALWGINDLIKGPATGEAVLARYAGWIDRARRGQPDIDLVIGKLPQTWVPGVEELNAGLDDLAREESTTRSPVIVAEHPEPFDSETDFSDGVHPTVSGDAKLGEMFESAWWTLAGETPQPLTTAPGGNGPCPMG